MEAWPSLPRRHMAAALLALVLALVLAEGTSVRPWSCPRASREAKSWQQPGRPSKKVAWVEGQLVLGGLMMVHERGEDNRTCGPIMPQGGVQALEAMLYSVDVLNGDLPPDMVPPGLLPPGVRLGAHVLDDCDTDTYGLEQAVDFIKGSISNIDDGEYRCPDGSSPAAKQNQVISGVVGAASSVTSIQVANLLRLFKIPQVSFFSTSPELSNKQRFEFFSRTIPSDHYQVQAMVQLVSRLSWTYVSIVYEESNYGMKALEELELWLSRAGTCIAVREKLAKDSGVAQDDAYDRSVARLQSKPRARGVIVFGSDQEVAALMRAVRRRNATGAFFWLGSDGWSARTLVSQGNEPEVEGTLSVQPQANPVRGFDRYFLQLHVRNNSRNPWFAEFWEHHFQCRLEDGGSAGAQAWERRCNGDERLSKENTEFEAQLQFVSDAVFAFAHAFRDMHRDLCGGKPGLCARMNPIDGTELLTYLRKVRFVGLSGDEFHFDAQGDAPARYNIIHFRQQRPGEYAWVKVGTYVEGELQLNTEEVQFRLGQREAPESVCSVECAAGQAKRYLEGERCCWHCFNCSRYQVRHPTDETQCFSCPLGTLPDASLSLCRSLPEEYLRADSAWAIGVLVLSSLGMLLTVVTGVVFVAHHDTAVVRAAGRELSYVLLVGLLLCYALASAFVLPPSDSVCALHKFGPGLCFATVYAALLTKTNRIARIFHAGRRSARRPAFISPRAQLLICAALVSVQVLGSALWMAVSPPRATYLYPTRDARLLVCASATDASYVLSLSYPMLLVLVCTVYAVLTRNIPEAFNESKHIGFTMYTTCVLWLAFVPIYLSTKHHAALRVTSVSVTICLSSGVALACLFTPKLYIVLLHPERNVRQSIMARGPPLLHAPQPSSSFSGTALASSRVDSCTQSEAADYELLDALRPLNSAASTVSRSTSATQTPSLGFCGDDFEEEEEEEGAGRRGCSSSSSSSSPPSPSPPRSPHAPPYPPQLLPAPHLEAAPTPNGPLQDVPDVQL